MRCAISKVMGTRGGAMAWASGLLLIAAERLRIVLGIRGVGGWRTMLYVGSLSLEFEVFHAYLHFSIFNAGDLINFLSRPSYNLPQDVFSYVDLIF